MPVRMGQNWFVSKKEIIRSQLPKAKTKLANRKMFAVEYTVNNFIEMKNIGIAVKPKINAHQFTVNNETP